MGKSRQAGKQLTPGSGGGGVRKSVWDNGRNAGERVLPDWLRRCAGTGVVVLLLCPGEAGLEACTRASRKVYTKHRTTSTSPMQERPREPCREAPLGLWAPRLANSTQVDNAGSGVEIAVHPILSVCPTYATQLCHEIEIITNKMCNKPQKQSPISTSPRCFLRICATSVRPAS